MEIKTNKNVQIEESYYLWKYFDLHKFLYFINEKKLFFTRLDNFEDPLEGLSGKTLLRMAYPPEVPENPNFHITKEGLNQLKKEELENKKQILEEIEQSQKSQFANCWFVDKKESFAMWKLYSNQDGVAIKYNKSNYFINLVKASAESYKKEDFVTFIYGRVEYFNKWPYDYYKEEDFSIIHSAFFKDKSYEHEKEYRFVVAIAEDCIGKYSDFELPLGNIGEDDFDIFANPYMEEWKIKNIQKLLDIYLQGKIIKRSELLVKHK